MKTFAEAAAEPAQADGVYVLYLTHEEGLAVLHALDDWNAHTPASTRAMQRLAARLGGQALLRDDSIRLEG